MKDNIVLNNICISIFILYTIFILYWQYTSITGHSHHTMNSMAHGVWPSMAKIAHKSGTDMKTRRARQQKHHWNHNWAQLRLRLIGREFILQNNSPSYADSIADSWEGFLIPVDVVNVAVLASPKTSATWQDDASKYLEGSFRYPLGREGVFVPGGRDCLAHARKQSSYIVGLTALRLAFFMGYG